VYPFVTDITHKGIMINSNRFCTYSTWIFDITIMEYSQLEKNRISFVFEWVYVWDILQPGKTGVQSDNRQD